MIVVALLQQQEGKKARWHDDDTEKRSNKKRERRERERERERERKTQTGMRARKKANRGPQKKSQFSLSFITLFTNILADNTGIALLWFLWLHFI